MAKHTQKTCFLFTFSSSVKTFPFIVCCWGAFSGLFALSKSLTSPTVAPSSGSLGAWVALVAIASPGSLAAIVERLKGTPCCCKRNDFFSFPKTNENGKNYKQINLNYSSANVVFKTNENGNNFILIS